jgi:hypothetical protein
MQNRRRVAEQVFRVSDSTVRRAVSDSADASPITAVHAGPDRSRSPCVLQYEPECRMGIPACGQLPIALHGLPSRRRVRSAGASTLHTPIVGTVFRVQRRARLCHSSSRRRAISAIQCGHGCPAQLDGEKLERCGSAARIHGLFRGGGPESAQTASGPGSSRQGTPAQGHGRAESPLRLVSGLLAVRPTRAP